MEKLDIYSIKPKLFIKKGETIPSKLGGIMTILTVILSLMISVHFLKDFLEGKNYTVSFTQENQNLYKLDFSNEPIFFGLGSSSNDSTIYTDWNKIFEISAFNNFKIQKTNLQEIKKEINLNIINCLEHKKFMKNKATLSEKIKDIPSWCLTSPNNNLTIYGENHNIYDSSVIKIEFSKCENTTENNFTCFSPGKIDEILSLSKFFWGSISYDIDHDMDNPFIPNPFMNIHAFKHKHFTRFIAQFNEVVYKSDEGWFYKDLLNFTNPMHDNTQIIVESSNSDSSSNAFLSFTIEVSGKTEIHYRKYQKLQEAFAQISVMLKIIRGVFGCIFGLIGDKIYFEHLINYLLSSNESDNKKKFDVFMQMREECLGDLKQKKHEKFDNHDKIELKTKQNDQSIFNEFKDDSIPQVINVDCKKRIKDIIDSNPQENQSDLQNSTFRNLNNNNIDKLNQNSNAKINRVTAIRRIIENKRQIPKNCQNNAFQIYNKSVDNKRNIEDSVLIKEEENKNTNFGISFKDFLISKFSKKRNSSIEKFENFVIVLKDLLSIELILNEISWLLDTKKIFESNLIYNNLNQGLLKLK